MSIALVWSKNLERASDALDVHQLESDFDETVCGKNAMTFALLQCCGLFEEVKILHPQPLSRKLATVFHDEDYMEALFNWKHISHESLTQFNLVDDAAPFEHVEKHALWIAGASITAANELIKGNCKVAINICGGRHHAMRDRASGFCYINDVVLAIDRLHEKFQKIICIDIDVHHGDGTESAFYHSWNVVTISFHMYQPGFFPGTGDEKDCGAQGKAHGCNVNVGFPPGTRGPEYVQRFNEVIKQQVAIHKPDAVVMVCGTDCLQYDPRGGLSLEIKDVLSCITTISQLQLPWLLLGGGGYHFARAARCWAHILRLLTKYESLPPHIPEHEYFEQYAPSWEL